MRWALLVSPVLGACCGSVTGGTCSDGTLGTPCCGQGKCNAFCCNCDGGCRAAPPAPPPVPAQALNRSWLEWPMILAHDAATTYAGATCSEVHLVNNYVVTQSPGSFGLLLDCGTRAFDVRSYVKDGKLILHHGPVVIDTAFAKALDDVVEWANAHPGDLVLFAASHCDGKSAADKQLCPKLVAEAFAAAKVPQLECGKLDMSLAQALARGRLPGGGSVLGLLECVTSNYDPSIKCYGDLTQEGDKAEDALRRKAETDPRFGPVLAYAAEGAAEGRNATARAGSFTCYGSGADQAFTPLWAYMSQHCDGAPPAGALWMAQAHWQYDTSSVAQGTLHGSCILEDEGKANVNGQVLAKLQGGAWPHLSLLELDYVCDHGRDILLALRGRYADQVLV